MKKEMIDIIERQKSVCNRFSADFKPCDLRLKVGVSLGAREGGRPLHGMRVKEENGASGWYIWTGDWSDKSDFFVPLHGEHLQEWASLILPYLGLPEGWRFLVAENYEDIWFDPNILND